MSADEHFLSVRDLHVTYRPARRGRCRRCAASTSISPSGETLGLAGESGCGKSSMAAALLRLLPEGTKVTGEVLLDGEDVLKMKPGRLRAVRWTDLAIVFQGALHTLNPVQRVGDQIAEAIRLHSKGSVKVSARVGELLELVGLPARRRAGLPARALGRPAPARADRSRARLRAAPPGRRRAHHGARRDGPGPGAATAGGPAAAFGLGIIFITHDLSTLADVCQRIAVMYAGRVVEQGPSEEVFAHAAHPYTRALGAAFPVIGDPAFRMNPSGVAGDPPDPRGAAERLPLPPALPGGGRRSAHRRTSSCGPPGRDARPPACTSPGRSGGRPA